MSQGGEGGDLSAPRRARFRRLGRLAALLCVLFTGWLTCADVARAEVPRIAPRVAGETVAAVRVQGNRRVAADEILYNIEMAPGEVVDLDVVSRDIKRIFEMGFFEDIQVDAAFEGDDLVLTYFVKEKPAVAQVTFVGNDELDEDELGEQLDIKTPDILDLAKVKANEEKLQALYEEKGYYLAEVDSEVAPIEGSDDVEVRFIIQERSQVRVKQITFIGNQAISDEELKGNIFTREDWALGFLSGAGEFKESELNLDVNQRLYFYYNDRGYLDVKISPPQVRLSPDRESLFITIHIEEGPQYTVEAVEVSGDPIDDDATDEARQEERARILDGVQLEAGAPYKVSNVAQDLQRIRNMYRDQGYAYAQVMPRLRKDEDARRITVVYDVQKGERVRIGRIDVVGNSATSDRVIRRELLIAEGELFNGTRLEASEASVTRLGFFEKVTISSEPAADPRFANVQVEVTERPTGTFQVGAGFSSVESFIATLQISQRNFLGRGQELTAQATFSGIRQLFNILFFERYFLDTMWRFRVSLYNFEFLYNDFSRSSTGATVTFGYPLTRLLSVDMTYTIEDVNVSPGGQLGRARRNIGSLFRGGLTSSTSVTLTYDDRNNRFLPTEGYFLQGGVEVADDTLGSENEFTRLTGRSRFYIPLFLSFVLRFNVEAGFISNWNSDNTPVPIFERFFVGGPNDVRGFRRASLGPVRDVAAQAGDPGSRLTQFNIGGNKQFIFNAEIEFPILTSVGIRGVFFADAGNAFDNNQDISLALDLFSDEADYVDVLRTAVGFGFRWLSPIGPLRFEWGFPLSPLEEEESQVFEFSIGNSF